MGRPRKPIEQQQRHNAGKRALPEPIAFGGIPVPQELPPDARELWNELIEPLTKAGVAQAPDRAMLEQFCMAWQRAVDARRVLGEKGLFARGSTGQLVEHPAYRIELEATRLMIRIATEYGLTAAARAKVAALRKLGETKLDDAVPVDDEPELRVIEGGQSSAAKG